MNSKHHPIHLTMPEIEALIKTLGIGVSNLMTKQSALRSDQRRLHESVGRELATLINIQQLLLGEVAAANDFEGDDND